MVVLETGKESVKPERYSSSMTSPNPAEEPIITSKNVGMSSLSAKTGFQSSVITLALWLALTASGCPVIAMDMLLQNPL